MLGNRIIHCPNWETFEGKGSALITMLNNGHRPGLSQGDRVPGQPTSRQSWLLSPLNFQSTLTLYDIPCACQFPHLSEKSTKSGPALLICISSISPVPGTEMTQSIINKSKCLFNVLSKRVREIRCFNLGQQRN